MLKDILMMALKGSIAVIYLFLVVKVLGKKQISELNVFDYIIGLSLGNIAAEMTVNKQIPILGGLVSMTVYGLFSLGVSYLNEKSILSRRFITGFPIVIIKDGKISREQLKKCKIDVNDLLQDARESGYFDISEINYAVMEPSGKVSFLPKAKYTPTTPSDMKLKVSEKALTYNLVIDGVIIKDSLKAIKHNEDWLLTRLEKEGYTKIDDLLLVTIDNKEKLTIYKSDEKFENDVLE